MNKASLNPDYSEELQEDNSSEIQDMSDLSDSELREVVYELKLRQTELEKQNNNLRSNLADLEQALDNYKDLYDFAPAAYFTVGKKGNILEVNLAGSALLNTKKQRHLLIGKLLADFIADEDLDIFHKHCKQVFARKTRQACEIKMVKKSGSRFHARFESKSVRVGSKCDRYRTIISDITEIKLTEQILLHTAQNEIEKQLDILQKEQNFTTAILDNAGALITVLDRKGRIIRFNRACERLTGYAFSEIQEKLLWEVLLAPEETDAMKHIFRHTHDEGIFPSTFENHWVTRQGEHRLIHWSNTETGKGKSSDNHIVSIGIDITGRREMEEETELRRRQLMQADKMISLGILVSGVAHEINNPNNFIMLNTPVLREAWDDSATVLDTHHAENKDFMVAGLPYPEMREYVPRLFDGIKDGTERIKKIVLNLKDYAREDTSDMTEIMDVNVVIRAALTLLTSQLKKSTKYLSLDFAENLPPVKGNSQRIEQVMINLIQNACQALSDKKKGIDIASFYDMKTDKVVVCIKDEGIGISQDNMDRIFDPFFTMKRDKGGTGLGLSICAGIVEEHGGKLEFSSEPGKGTAAFLALPAFTRLSGFFNP
ncbi:MAG: PAS domain S-box protein [Desulfobacterales bacterium]|nr:PAS domain S-box protein [Desulfobacterales bacterium]